MRNKIEFFSIITCDSRNENNLWWQAKLVYPEEEKVCTAKGTIKYSVSILCTFISEIESIILAILCHCVLDRYVYVWNTKWTLYGRIFLFSLWIVGDIIVCIEKIGCFYKSTNYFFSCRDVTHWLQTFFKKNLE